MRSPLEPPTEAAESGLVESAPDRPRSRAKGDSRSEAIGVRRHEDRSSGYRARAGPGAHVGVVGPMHPEGCSDATPSWTRRMADLRASGCVGMLDGISAFRRLEFCTEPPPGALDGNAGRTLALAENSRPRSLVRQNSRFLVIQDWLLRQRKRRTFERWHSDVCRGVPVARLGIDRSHARADGIRHGLAATRQCG